MTTVEGIAEYRLDNGLRVLLFRDPSKATITVNVTYLVGSVDESYGETGMAHLLEHMLFKGSTKYPDMLAALRSRGAQFNGSTDRGIGPTTSRRSTRATRISSGRSISKPIAWSTRSLRKRPSTPK